jgi:hypothetical protein
MSRMPVQGSQSVDRRENGLLRHAAGERELHLIGLRRVVPLDGDLGHVHARGFQPRGNLQQRYALMLDRQRHLPHTVTAKESTFNRLHQGKDDHMMAVVASAAT